MHQVHAKDGGRPGKGDFCLLFSLWCLGNRGIEQSCSGLARAGTPQDEGTVDIVLSVWGQAGNACYLRAIGEGTCQCLFLEVSRVENSLGLSLLSEAFSSSWDGASQQLARIGVIFNSPFLSLLG